MNRGYVKFWRKLQDSSLWLSEKFTRGQAWIDMIGLANHKDGFIRIRGNHVPVKRGQLARSEITLAKRWKWSRGKVRRFLLELELNDGEKTVQQKEKNEPKIVQRKSHLTTLITILNYELYQGTGLQTVQQNPPKRYTNKNVKNVKKEKEYISFEDLFWKYYPKKVGKKVSFELFKNIPIEIRETFPVVLNTQIKDKAEKKAKGLFVPAWPDPERWLKKARWEDEIEKPKSGGRFTSGDCVKCGKLFDKLEDGFCETCRWKYPK